MRILAVLLTVSLVRLCHGKGGNKRYHYGENGPCNNSKKAQSTPQPTVTPPSQPTPIVDSKSKVDTSLFNVEESFEGSVKILKFTAKPGVSASKLTYGGEVVWENINNKVCLSAVLYMDGEKPTLAVLVTRDKNNKQGTVYRYHDGKKWQDDREFKHKNKLEALKEKYKPKDSLEAAKKEQGIPPVQPIPQRQAQAKSAD